jgi:hypothetical protein
MSEETAYDSKDDVKEVHSETDSWKRTGKFFCRHYLFVVFVVSHHFGFLSLWQMSRDYEIS